MVFNKYLTWAALSLIFSIPLSTALTNVLLLGYILVWLFNVKRYNLLVWFKHPAAIVSGMLLAWMIISTIYSPATWVEKSHAIKHYAKLLLIPLLIPAFVQLKDRRLALNLFIAASAILVLTAYAILPSSPLCSPLSKLIFSVTTKGNFKDNIFTSLFAAFSIYILVNRLLVVENHSKLNNEKSNSFKFIDNIFNKSNGANFFYYSLNLGLLIFFSYYLYFIGIGRSGQIIGAVLLLLALLGQSKKTTMIGGAMLMIFIAMILTTNSSFSMRIKQAASELSQYLQSKSVTLVTAATTTTNSTTAATAATNPSTATATLPTSPTPLTFAPLADNNSSTGIRTEFALNSWQLFSQKPWFGWGMASFAKVYNEQFSQRKLTTGAVYNPHNQYLLILTELGLVGMLLYLGWFSKLWSLRTVLPVAERRLLTALLVALILGGGANSWLLDFTSSVFFFVLIAVCLGSSYPANLASDPPHLQS